jgi:3'-5' exonuclease
MTIYLLKQTRPYINSGHLHLPSALLAFLHSSAHKKVGVSIAADLKKLQGDCNVNRPFTGYVELGGMAKDRNAAERRNIGLVALTGTVLRRNLKNDPTIRISTHWAEAQLSQDFINYAALNVYATWAVYDTLDRMDVPQPISATSPAGTLVTLHATDGQPVADGIIAFDRPKQFHGVNVTPGRAIVTVSEVMVPSYLIPASLQEDKISRPLSHFGNPPFSILSAVRSLRTRSAPSGEYPI